MTPKEKAIELFDKFRVKVHDRDGTSAMNEFEAKQCALILINEMIDRLTWHTGASDLGNTILVGDIDYWHEVKQKIENL